MLLKNYGSNPTLQGQIARFKRLGGRGRVKTREQGGGYERSLSQGNLGIGFEYKVSTKIQGSEVGTEIHGSEVGAKLHGSELGATNLGSNPGAKIYGSEVPATSMPQPGTSVP